MEILESCAEKIIGSVDWYVSHVKNVMGGDRYSLNSIMKIKAMNGVARILKAEGVNWISCYPTSPINNALGEEGVPIYMMGEERFGIAVADAYSRVTCGKQIG